MTPETLLATLSIISGTAVGLAGVLASYRAARLQASTALQLGRAQLQHQADMVREERHQRRVESTYGDLLHHIEKRGVVAEFVHVKTDYIEIENAESWVTPDEITRTSFLWSDEVLDLHKALCAAELKMIAKAMEYHQALGQFGGKQLAAPSEVTKLRAMLAAEQTEVEQASKRLVARIRSELTGVPAGTVDLPSRWASSS